jgi:hypothetical protein
MSGPQIDPEKQEEAIRLVRAESNAALGRHDVADLARCWAPDYAIVTSTNVHAVGRAASLARMTAAYEAKPDMAIARNPTSVEVYEPWGMAAENGRWESSWTAPTGRMAPTSRSGRSIRMRAGSFKPRSMCRPPVRGSPAAIALFHPLPRRLPSSRTGQTHGVSLLGFARLHCNGACC